MLGLCRWEDAFIVIRQWCEKEMRLVDFLLIFNSYDKLRK